MEARISPVKHVKKDLLIYKSKQLETIFIEITYKNGKTLL